MRETQHSSQQLLSRKSARQEMANFLRSRFPRLENSPKVGRLEFNYRAQTNLGVALAGLFILAPFCLNHIVHGRLLLGCVSLCIVTLLAYNAWSIRHKMVIPWTTPFVLSPAMVLFLATSVRLQGVVGAFWSYPSIIAFYFMLKERHAHVLNGLLLAMVIPLAYLNIPTPMAMRIAATLITVSIFAALSIRVINVQQENLGKMAVTDPMTGLHNRALLEATLVQGIEQARRSHLPISLAMLDLDHFKNINDSFGHAIGDRVLITVAQTLKGRLRKSDMVFRLGGEEFMALLYNTGDTAADAVAEELRRSVSECTQATQHVTVSVGSATLRDDETWSQWLKRADSYLYEAKARGRDQVVSEKESPSLVSDAMSETDLPFRR